MRKAVQRGVNDRFSRFSRIIAVSRASDEASVQSLDRPTEDNATYLFGLESQICLLGGCLLITQVP